MQKLENPRLTHAKIFDVTSKTAIAAVRTRNEEIRKDQIKKLTQYGIMLTSRPKIRLVFVYSMTMLNVNYLKKSSQIFQFGTSEQ